MSEYSEFGPNQEKGGDESGKRFRDRQRLNLAFGQIIKQLEAEEPAKKRSQQDLILDGIDRVGVNAFAEAALESLHLEPEPYIPAPESEVRSFLEFLRTNPPIRIDDIGSVDAELIDLLKLSKDHYIDQIRDILSFLDVNKPNISVLDFPSIKTQMDELELSALKKSLTVLVLEDHGISFVYDMNDSRVWSQLKNLVEELSRPHFRDYSEHLRTKLSVTGERTPIRDVYSVLDERTAIRENAFNMARENVSATDVERRRMYEAMPGHMRGLVQRFLEDLDAASHPTDENLESE
jgi:hypothetical protein